MAGKENKGKGTGEKKEKKGEMPEITKDIGIQELVQAYPESVEVLMKRGFHCLGCIAAQFETLEQGAEAHGIDVSSLVDDIRKAVKGGRKAKKAE